ncbi:CPBP family intramembrane glutamic endopeptidase [Myceligenerans pegani]|uniref:CPBP family intramembrane metalloprotease n=1 Tax=Myceligenerans pegani TaxID=2776917 RepID=A0ABR9N4W7_9MICO|nr:CPBP family intramembrane glutamic endopeptidase [Myceligenerans sp. TRM 65318]MBE1878032.1 CPBP family intramembrane metalloprotease [Myceligenerans sp. TRM 65318]MBE3020303.1 CPBP family intramembrane metalloprotease [Myceligenerans sp. TRM 65318]
MTELRPYPQAWRGPRHRWWRPLLAIAVMLGGAVVFFVWSAFAQLGAVFANDPAEFVNRFEETALDTEWLTTPLGLLATNISLAIPIPMALLAALVATGRPGLVSSVTGRLRWGLLAGAVGTSVLVLVPLGFVLEAFAPASSEQLTIAPEQGWQLVALVILLTTPLQAAGEEYFFRGWVQQVVGAWCRPAWLAVVLPMVISATLFALAHGLQNPWLFADRFFFGLVASVLVWRTGGLECAIALHVVNNLFAFGAAIATGTMAETMLITEVSPLSGVLSMTGTAVVAAALLAFARWRRAQRLTP